MFTMNQLVAHLVGDYLFQSHTEATNKTTSNWYAFTHAFKYTLPFVLITQNWVSLLLIFGTHFIIDRFRLARYWNWLKNDPIEYGDEVTLKEVTSTGYPEDVPAWLSVWLLIITDNIIHILINGCVIYFLG